VEGLRRGLPEGIDVLQVADAQRERHSVPILREEQRLVAARVGKHRASGKLSAAELESQCVGHRRQNVYLLAQAADVSGTPGNSRQAEDHRNLQELLVQANSA